MQTLDSEPTDRQLATLLEPQGRSLSLHMEDSPARLTVHPRGFPMAFVVCFMIVIYAIMLGMVIYAGNHDAVLVTTSFGLLTVPAGLGFIYLMNHEMLAPGAFAILDKTQRTLALPRQSVVLRGDQILCFTEVHGWLTWRDGGGSASNWVAELGVVATLKSGELVRYPILMCDYSRECTRVGRALAEFFGVERRYLKAAGQIPAAENGSSHAT